MVRAPGGLVVWGVWEVCGGDGVLEGGGGGGGGAAGLVVRETTTVRCLLLLMPFVRATMGRSHGELHRRFVGRLLDELGSGGVEVGGDG